MKFTHILDRLKGYAKANPLVQSVTLGDLYENLNSKPDGAYANVNIDIITAQRDDNMIRYQIYLYYTDRLFEDKHNWMEIKDASETVLHSIINYANEAIGEVDENYTISFFEQQFADYCAGGYVNFYIEVPNELGNCIIDDYIIEEDELVKKLKEIIKRYEEENAELSLLLKQILYKLTGETVE